MLDQLRDFMNGRPPLSSGAKLLFLGLFVMLAGVVLMKVTTADYWWAAIFAGLATMAKGGIDESRIKGE
jgi:hypothetical protein